MFLVSDVSYPVKRRVEVAIGISAAVKQLWGTPTEIHNDIRTGIFHAFFFFKKKTCPGCAITVFQNDLMVSVKVTNPMLTVSSISLFACSLSVPAPPASVLITDNCSISSSAEGGDALE